MATIGNKGPNKITEQDFELIRRTLTGKVPDSKVLKFMMDVQKANDMIDVGDSPYNRMSFPKLLLLSGVIFGLFYFVLIPFYSLLFSEENPENIEQALITKRERGPNENLAINVKIEELPNGRQIVKVYDGKGVKELGVGDLQGSEAYVLAENLGGQPIQTEHLEIIKTTQADLDEDIKQEVVELKKDNYSIENSYKEFEAIDFGVDDIINTSGQE